MEQGLNSLILNEFGIEKKDINTYSPLVLAYIGDAVFDIIVRTVLVGRGNTRVDNLHRLASSLVNAGNQAEMIKKLLPVLSEEEEAVYRRGRNAKPHSTAKNSSHTQYREATGFESLIGWLYLRDDWDRLFELVNMALRRNKIA